MDSTGGDEEWPETVPARLERCARLWGLDVGERLSGGYLANVHGCIGPDGEDLVLKLSPPVASPRIEARALMHWDGHGAVELVAWDEECGALLLRRIRPGAQLLESDRSPGQLNDERAVTAAAGALRQLQSRPLPAVTEFPSFEDKLQWWLSWTAVHGEPTTAGMAMLSEATRCARALDASAARKCLAHGDFLAKNLLEAPDGSYVAIDPLPYIGDPASDIGHFSSYHSPVATVVPRARAIAAETGNDPDRAALWTVVWMIGEACETWREDSDDVQAWVQGPECRRLLAECG